MRQLIKKYIPKPHNSFSILKFDKIITSVFSLKKVSFELMPKNLFFISLCKKIFSFRTVFIFTEYLSLIFFSDFEIQHTVSIQQ